MWGYTIKLAILSSHPIIWKSRWMIVTLMLRMYTSRCSFLFQKCNELILNVKPIVPWGETSHSLSTYLGIRFNTASDTMLWSNTPYNEKDEQSPSLPLFLTLCLYISFHIMFLAGGFRFWCWCASLHPCLTILRWLIRAPWVSFESQLHHMSPAGHRSGEWVWVWVEGSMPTSDGFQSGLRKGNFGSS